MDNKQDVHPTVQAEVDAVLRVVTERCKAIDAAIDAEVDAAFAANPNADVAEVLREASIKTYQTMNPNEIAVIWVTDKGKKVFATAGMLLEYQKAKAAKASK